MTSIVSSTFNPRSYIYSSNSETLILQSATPETRLSFINSSYPDGNFRYLMSATIQQLSVESVFNNIITPFQTFSAVAGVPNIETYGTTITSNLIFSPNSPNQNQLIIFQNANPASSKQFSGFGIDNSTNSLTYYIPGIPHNITSHIFYTGVTDTTSKELLKITAHPISGLPQVGIGLAPNTIINPSTSLSLAGDAQVGGNLIVQDITLNPNNIVQVDAVSQRIASNLLPTGIVFVSESNNKIDPSLVPTTVTGTSFKTYKNFGLGTRNPTQQLHVEGSTYISERLGVGMAYPAHRLHIVESAAGIPTAALYNTSGGDVLHTFISSNIGGGGGSRVNVPVLTVVGTHAGVGIGTNAVNLVNALQVNGNTDTTSLSVKNINISNNLSSTLKTISLRDNNLTPLIFYNNNISNNILNILAPTSFTSNCVFNDNLVSYGPTTFYNFVNNVSDIRTKYDTKLITNSLEKVNSINGYTYSLHREKYTIYNNNRHAGVLAQEIQNILPEAVAETHDGMLGVKYDSLIPLLIESIKELTAKVNDLELRLLNR